MTVKIINSTCQGPGIDGYIEESIRFEESTSDPHLKSIIRDTREMTVALNGIVDRLSVGHDVPGHLASILSGSLNSIFGAHLDPGMAIPASCDFVVRLSRLMVGGAAVIDAKGTGAGETRQ